MARVFHDRLTSEDDKEALYREVATQMRDKLKDDVVQVASKVLGTKLPGVELLEDGIVFADCIAGRSHYDEVMPEERQALKEKLERMLEDHNSMAKVPLAIVIFDFAMTHLLRIGRILKMPTKGHALVIGLQGTGRQSLSKLASSLSDH